MKRMQLIVAVFATVVAGAVPASAHTAEYFDSHPSPHGGQRRMAGPYHIELVTGPGEITVYLANHANVAVPTAGGEGKAVVRSGKDETLATIALTPGENNILKGKGQFTLGQDGTVVVFVKLPGQEAWGAEFTPLKPKPNASMEGMDMGHDHDEDHDDHDHDDHDHGDH